MATTGNNIVTPQAPLAGSAKLTVANTNYDTAANAVQLIGTVTNGARITRLVFTAGSTVTATDCQIYVSPDSGTTKRNLGARNMAAQTISAGNTAAITPVDFGFSDSAPLILNAGESLWAAIGVAQTSVIARAEGGLY